MTDRPLLLLTNDDGVQADGLKALRQALLPLGRVVVVAPSLEQSASSHSITLYRPLRHIEHEPDVHSFDGTPADCVYLAFYEPRLLGRRPDCVLSGINHGNNTGTSVFYSGTVAGAREAAMRGVPAVAFSSADKEQLQANAALARQMVERLLKMEHPPGPALLLNVNFPKGAAKGARATRAGQRIFEDDVVVRNDPGGREYFWIGGKAVVRGDEGGTDTEALAEGVVSVTPLLLETTGAEHLAMAAHVGGMPDSEEPQGTT